MYPENETRRAALLKCITTMRKHYTAAFKAQLVREVLKGRGYSLEKRSLIVSTHYRDSRSAQAEHAEGWRRSL